MIFRVLSFVYKLALSIKDSNKQTNEQTMTKEKREIGKEKKNFYFTFGMYLLPLLGFFSAKSERSVWKSPDMGLLQKDRIRFLFLIVIRADNRCL